MLRAQDMLKYLEAEGAHALVLRTPALQALGGVTEGETQSNKKHGLSLIWLPQKAGVRDRERLLFVDFRQALSHGAIQAMQAGCQQRNRQVQAQLSSATLTVLSAPALPAK
tara:strand:- start:200 stop:532 length:333 start_codon:yes stop_codon:yes gene_type:complete